MSTERRRAAGGGTGIAGRGAFGEQAAVHLRTGIERSRQPMLICDDHRRWITGNDAGRRLLRTSAHELPWRTIDEYTDPDARKRLEEQWQAFLTSGAAEGWYELRLPDRGAVLVEFSAIAHVLPSRHLSIFIPPDSQLAQAPPPPEPVWNAAPPKTDRARLTGREREVITLIAGGGHSSDIAERLYLSSETVKTHAQNAMHKLGAHTRAHAVAIALVTGQVSWSMVDGEAPPDA